MRKVWFFSFILAVVLNGRADAELITSNSFESATPAWGFSVSPDAYDAASHTDVWSVATAIGTSTNGISASDGSQFWAMRDIDNGIASGEHKLTTAVVDVSNYSGVEISFDYNVYQFDNGDDLYYELFVDGVSTGSVKYFDGAGNLSTAGWVTQTLSIDDAASTVSLSLSAYQNGDGDWAGWDNLQVNGTFSAVPEPTSLAYGMLALTTLTLRRRRR